MQRHNIGLNEVESDTTLPGQNRTVCFPRLSDSSSPFKKSESASALGLSNDASVCPGCTITDLVGPWKYDTSQQFLPAYEHWRRQLTISHDRGLCGWFFMHDGTITGACRLQTCHAWCWSRCSTVSTHCCSNSSGYCGERAFLVGPIRHELRNAHSCGGIRLGARVSEELSKLSSHHFLHGRRLPWFIAARPWRTTGSVPMGGRGPHPSLALNSPSGRTQYTSLRKFLYVQVYDYLPFQALH